ncbi:addiction module protein [Wenzhouxiangella sp. XN24]|nr:addiction module protein [Wenzhouxiangella sp. XN24]
MSTDPLSKLRSDALSLPEADRAELARTLVKSLDSPADPDAGEAWEREIARRLAEIDAGTAKLLDRSEFNRLMQARIPAGPRG